MDYYTCVFILGILFWLLIAAAVVCLLAYTYIQVMYYHWNKQDHDHEKIVSDVIETVQDELSQIKDSENSTDTQAYPTPPA